MLFRLKTLRAGTLLLGILAAGLALPSSAAERTSFNVAWSIYVGWMPWGLCGSQRHLEEVGR